LPNRTKSFPKNKARAAIKIKSLKAISSMKKQYILPSVEEITFDHLQLMTESPSPGTNEGIEIEDWSTLAQ